MIEGGKQLAKGVDVIVKETNQIFVSIGLINNNGVFLTLSWKSMPEAWLGVILHMFLF